jgi:hypothetical protein
MIKSNKNLSEKVLSKPDKYAVNMMDGLETYKIGIEAIITLQPSTGYVAVSCPFHDELNGCHWWTARGDLSLHEFLIKIDRDYAMMKLFAHRSLEEFDEERTKKALRKFAREQRKERLLSKDELREILDQITEAETADDVARIVGIDYPYEFIHNKPKRCALWFWDDVWSAFIKHIQASLQRLALAPPDSGTKKS